MPHAQPVVERHVALGSIALKDVAQIPEPIRVEFERLAQEWKSGARFLSSSSESAMNPSYQRIIGLGPIAIPPILRELSREPNHWFWALRCITDASPERTLTFLMNWRLLKVRSIDQSRCTFAGCEFRIVRSQYEQNSPTLAASATFQ